MVVLKSKEKLRNTLRFEDNVLKELTSGVAYKL